MTNRSMQNDKSRPAIRIEGLEYEILEELSLPNRGRWKVRDPHPRPRGTIRTAIVLDDTPASRQLERSLRCLPSSVNEIPQLHVCGYHAGKKVWIVSWQKGITIERYLEKVHEGRFLQRPSVWESVRRTKSLAYALRILAQDCQIVHGDIKPSNLILPRKRGSVFLIDFGSSWQMERTNLRVLGDGVQAAYAAPEILMDRHTIDSRSDQFSAGVVLYEMLTMELPYCGLGGKAGLSSDQSDLEMDHKPPSQLVVDSDRIPSSILAELDMVVGRLLQLDADRRYGTPTEFCQAINALWHRLQGAQDAIAKNPIPSNPSTTETRYGVRIPTARMVMNVISKLLGGQ